MTEPLQTPDLSSTPPAAASTAFVEKTPLERYVPPDKPSLVGLSRAQLTQALASIGVPKDLRAELARHFTLARPEVVAEQVSVDGTRKWLLRLPGEHSGEASAERPHEVECVYIPEADRGTLCVSSQVGCTLTCSFCHT